MPLGKKWLTPAEAAKLMSEQAGYTITTDDIRQLRRTNRLRKVQKLSERITLYDADEIRSATPPKKRDPQPLKNEDKDVA